MGVTLLWDREQCNFCPPPRKWEVWPRPLVGGLWEGRGLRDWAKGGAGGRPRHCSCPFTVSVSEAALTRTSAIRLPPSLGPETRGGGGEGRGWGLWVVGEESPPTHLREEGEESLAPENCPLSRQTLKGLAIMGERVGRKS